MIDETTIEWNDQTEFPGELGENGFSVDVLIFDTLSEERTVGFYDFKSMTWRFLLNEDINKFKWRYFQDEIDKPIIKKSYNEKTKIIKKSRKTGNQKSNDN